MSFPTVINHSKRYPATSIMAEPYNCDPLGLIGCAAGIEQLKADQADVGTMIVPAGQFLIDANLTIPATMDVRPYAGAKFYINSGKVLTFASQTGIVFYKGRLFLGTGKVSFPNGSIVRTSWIGGLVNLATYIYGTPDITVIIDTDETITANLTIADNFKLSSPFGTIVTITDGVTVTVAGPVDSSNPPHFDFVGTGTVVYNSTAVSLYVYPQMWGAKADGTTNDTAPVNTAFDAGETFNLPVFLPSGVYLCSNLLFGSNTAGAESTGPPQIYGTGGQSILRALDGTTGVFFKAVNLKGKSFRDFTLDGNDKIGLTSVIDTSWYAFEPNLHNRFINVTVINYANTGWTGAHNNDCDFDFVAVLDPTSTSNQRAFNIQAPSGPVFMNSCVGEGYLAASATVLTLSGCQFAGLDTDAQTNDLLGTQLTSNNITDACIAGNYGAMVVVGGALTTSAGHNHLAGVTSTGALFLGTRFDGESGEDVLATDLAGTIGLPIIEFKNCFITGDATLNYDPCPVGVRVRISSFNINDVSILDLAISPYVTMVDYAVLDSPHSYTPGALAESLLVVLHGSGAGGAGGTHGGGGGGGGTSIESLLVADITTPVTVTVAVKGLGGDSAADGNDGHTTSFGAYLSATGGSKGLILGGVGGVGGIGVGGNINITGEAGGTDSGTGGGYGGASFSLHGGARQNTSGENGNNYGGGGAGNLASAAGGDGADGRCTIYEFPAELRYLSNLLTQIFGYLGL